MYPAQGTSRGPRCLYGNSASGNQSARYCCCLRFYCRYYCILDRIPPRRHSEPLLAPLVKYGSPYRSLDLGCRRTGIPFFVAQVLFYGGLSTSAVSVCRSSASKLDHLGLLSVPALTLGPFFAIRFDTVGIIPAFILTSSLSDFYLPDQVKIFERRLRFSQ